MAKVATWDVEEAARQIKLYASRSEAETLTTDVLAMRMIKDFLVWQVGTPNFNDKMAWDNDRLTDEEYDQRVQARQLELADWVIKVSAWVDEVKGVED